jgi:glycosyltransferase involved in cell wall biosynthesis
VIPAFQEQEKIEQVVAGARKYAREVIVIDDGSCDRTGEVASRAGATVLRHPENRGKGEALNTGFSYARAQGHRIAVVMDADGQHDPQEIPKLLKALERFKADVVVGSRMRKPTGMPPVRVMTNSLMSVILSILTKKRCSDTQSGFRAIDLKGLGALSLKAKRFDWDSEFFIRAVRAGMGIKEVGIQSIYRSDARSKIRAVPDTIRFIALVLRNVIF